MQIVEIDVDSCDENPHQHRIEYSEEDLRRLSGSISRNGVIQPITARQQNGRYVVCAGWMRVLACRNAKIKSVPAIIRDLTDFEMARLGLAENLVRKNPNVIEQAQGLNILHKEFNMPYDEIGRDLGISGDIVAQRVRLLNFAPELKDSLSHDKISVSNAEALNRLASYPSYLKIALEKVISEKLTTSQATEMVNTMLDDIRLDQDVDRFTHSEQFLFYVHRIATDAIENGIPTKSCPVCFGSSLEETAFGGLICRRCGWKSETIDDAFFHIMRRVRARMLRRQGSNIPP